MKELIDIVNQVFELEKKFIRDGVQESYDRNIKRLQKSLEQLGVKYHNPIGEHFSETRTDVEATVLRDSSINLKISEVIKPIVYYQGVLVQLGIVIVN